MKTLAADEVFSWCIRERSAWTCERCGTVYVPPTKALHCAHFKGRGRWSTRFHQDNAAALCYGCHRYIDTHDAEKNAFFRRYLGDTVFEEMERRSNQPAHGIKKELRSIAAHYRKQYEQMQSQRAQGVTGRIEFEGYA